jgi:hypothetical protein
MRIVERRLLAAHHRRARVGPGEDEARTEGTAAHAGKLPAPERDAAACGS